jgi:hypothetical protein
MSNLASPLEAAAVRALAKLALAYPDRFHVAPATLPLWLEMLHDVEAVELETAVAQWIASEKWPPTIADIRGRVPRLCRCGKCSACHRRAVQRAMRSGPGANLDTPVEPTFNPRSDQRKLR